jgi:hypothetical protein
MKSPTRRFTVLILIVSLFSPLVVHSQTLNPSYLSEMPSPARVLAEIKGKDPADAGMRQLGAFMILVTLMSDMAYGLEHRFERQLTPDEQRITNVYTTAYTQLWHKVKDTYGKQYMGDYDHDRDLRNEVLDKFFSANFKALYTRSNQQANKQLQAARDRAYGNTPANVGSSQPSVGSGQSSPPTGGPGSTAEMNRCVASGRTLRRCMTEVMGNGFSPFMLGINPNEPIPVPDGLRMTGDYASANGFRIIFEPEAATMICRGVPSPHLYKVELTDTQALIKIENDPKPLVLSLLPDGKLSGSGPIRVTGQVAAGSHTQQTTGMTTQSTARNRELTPLEAKQYPNAEKNGQTYTIQEDSTQLVYGPTGTQTVTNYVSRTADCTVGLMSPIGGSPMPMVNEISKNPLAYLMAIFSGSAVLMKGGNPQDALQEMLNPKAEKAVAPGLRMHGRYSGASGFSLSFHPESVTLGCGDSERALEYSVQRTGNNAVLVAKENGKPISFQLTTDGSIVGEGTVQVNGRVITGTTEDLNNPFTFAPHVARCEVGRLSVGGAAASLPIATSLPSNSNPAPVANAGPSVATSEAISLTISAGPSVASLLANKPLVVLKESMENILANAGVSSQGRSSRISAWAHACETAATDPVCQAGISQFRNYYVSGGRLDANGSTTFTNIPRLGSFYILVDTSRARHLMWNVRVDLKQGHNSVQLNESNITPIDR